MAVIHRMQRRIWKMQRADAKKATEENKDKEDRQKQLRIKYSEKAKSKAVRNLQEDEWKKQKEPETERSGCGTCKSAVGRKGPY